MERTSQARSTGAARRPAGEPEAPRLAPAATARALFDQRAEALQRRALLPSPILPASLPASGVVQRYPLNLANPDPGVPTRWMADTRGEGASHLVGWIEEAAAASNLPALLDLANQLNAIAKRLPVSSPEQGLLALTVLKYQAALAKIRVPGATYLPDDTTLAQALDPAETLTMRAVNTGDMYQIRASMVQHPTFKLLLSAVTPTSRSQAEMAAAVMNAPGRVFYITAPNAPKRFSAKNEVWTTEDIEKGISQTPGNAPSLDAFIGEPGFRAFAATEAFQTFAHRHGLPADPGAGGYGASLRKAINKARGGGGGDADIVGELTDLYRKHKIEALATAYAPYTGAKARRFDQDLADRGRFGGLAKPAVIVNFRETGHSSRPGANAPALDTGLDGVKQINIAVREALGLDVQVVPMGEQPADLADGPNLLKYWEWPSVTGDRFAQTQILKRLRDVHPIVGAVGMRSGVMDQLALLGIPIVSIDITPHRGLADGVAPDLSTSKGWDRGLKLEDSYKQNYGHAFIEHERTDEKTRGLKRWGGAFDPEDLAAIKDSIRFYLADPLEKKLGQPAREVSPGPRATASAYRHSSHPLASASLNTAIRRLMGLLHRPEGISAYALVDNIHPYVSQLANLAASKRAGESAKLNDLMANLESQTLAVIATAETDQPQSIKWMRDHRRPALLDNRPADRWYKEQRLAMAKEFGLPADEAVERYRALHLHYQAAVSVAPLTDALGSGIVLLALASARRNIAAIAAMLPKPHDK